MTLTSEQNKLIEDHIDAVGRVATSLSRKYTNYTWDELYSIGLEGACRAAMAWDPQKYHDFERFMVGVIYRFIIDTFRREMKWNKHTKKYSMVTVSLNESIATEESKGILGFSNYYDGNQKDRDRDRVPLHNDQHLFEFSDAAKKVLSEFSNRDRQILIDSASLGGEATAQKYQITPGRVSQIKTKARQKWQLNLES